MDLENILSSKKDKKHVLKDKEKVYVAGEHYDSSTVPDSNVLSEIGREPFLREGEVIGNYPHGCERVLVYFEDTCNGSSRMASCDSRDVYKEKFTLSRYFLRNAQQTPIIPFFKNLKKVWNATHKIKNKYLKP